jgi:tRNA dimethylallyltransferase
MFSFARGDSLFALLPLHANTMVEPLNPGTVYAQPESDYPLLVIVGRTAAGKSALALALAERWDGEVVNFDSMQLYRGFNIGTGKLALEEQRGIPHHLLDCVEPSQVFTAGDYAKEAALALAAIRGRAKLPILAGGTGLYLRALLVGLFEGPGRSETLRARLSRMVDRHGREFLHRMLRRLDPETAARIQPRDAQKNIRAIEVCMLARRPFSSLLAEGRTGLQGFRAIKIGLNPDRAALESRINARVEDMFARGLMGEAQALFEDMASTSPDEIPKQGPYGSLGYPQAVAAARGKIKKEVAIQETQTATRRYAKRQRTWFRREPDVQWFVGFGDDPAIQQDVFNYLAGVGIKPAPAAAGVAKPNIGQAIQTT